MIQYFKTGEMKILNAFENKSFIYLDTKNETEGLFLRINHSLSFVYQVYGFWADTLGVICVVSLIIRQ